MQSQFTDKAKTALLLAGRAAKSLHQNYVGTEHILLGLIKEGTGRTFLQIIRDIKLNQACRALRETNLSIPSICELVGYETPEHFMRTFKKAYGMTPGEYRRKPS